MDMDPVSISLMGAGLLLRGYGQWKANQDQAEAEERNASFYREQARFAEMTGERQRDIFDRESDILYGEQLGAFAKAGVDASNSSFFMAKQMLYRQQESYAIKEEADMNVRLAMLRADQSERNADRLTSSENTLLGFATLGVEGAAKIYGG